jgi:quercetin dioxygenase-like cupin family protein
VAGHRLAICLVRFEPGTANEIEDSAHDGDEAMFVLSGSVHVQVDGRDVQLESGDSLHFRCDQAHRIRNSSAVAMAEVVLVADRRLAPALRKRLSRAAVA